MADEFSFQVRIECFDNTWVLQRSVNRRAATVRIVVCYYFRERSIALGTELATAFTDLGHAVHRFDSTARGANLAYKRVAKSLAKLVGAKEKLSAWFSARQERELARDFSEFCQKVRPELILVIRGERMPLDAVTGVADRWGARTVVWWVKNPRWESRLAAEAEYYDRAFSINEAVCGHGIAYLPSWALNRKMFFPLSFSQKTQQLLFVGTWSPRRQRFLEEISDLPLEIIGPNWRKRLALAHSLRSRVAAEWAPQPEMAARYRAAWAVIDIRQIDQDHAQGVNMRFADVPASGTVLITEPSREADRWQLMERCIVLFATPESLRQAAIELLAEGGRCAAMSGKGVEISAAMPTFADRASTILQSLACE